MNKVQWLNDQGGWEIGRIFRPTRANFLLFANRGIQPAYDAQGHDEILVIPYHDPGNPVFVEYGKLTPRPDQHHE